MSLRSRRVSGRARATTAQCLSCAIVLAGLAGCGASQPEYSSNEGAKAWLALHGGAVPDACTTTLIERYGDTQMITEASRAEAKSRALEIAGRVYALALAGDQLITATTEVLKTAEEGVARGFVVPQAVEDAKSELYMVKSDVGSKLKHSMMFMESCEFDAAHASLGIEPVGDPGCVYRSDSSGGVCKK